VLFGDGAGDFPSQVKYRVGDHPTCVRAADVDADGDLDLLTLNADSDDVSLLRNDGRGRFGPQQRFAAGGVPLHLIFLESPGPHFDVGDVDGDGDLDLALPHEGAWYGVLLLLNDGAGQFTPSPERLVTDAHTHVVGLGDLNNDGKLDVAASASSYLPSYRGLSVFLQTARPAAPRFAPPQHYAFFSDLVNVSGTSIAIGDVTGDGWADIVVTPMQMHYEGVFFFRNRGDGTFGPPAEFSRYPEAEFIPIQAWTWFAALADVNRDGWLDLAAVSGQFTGPTLRVLLNDGAGTLLREQRWPQALHDFCQGVDCYQMLYDLAAGDLDCDGDIDLVAANCNMDSLYQLKVFLNDGAGAFPRIERYSWEPLFDYQANYVALGDLDGDGYLDVVYTDGTFDVSGVLWTMFNRGDGTFGRAVRYPLDGLDPQRAVCADFDRDGDLDVAVWASGVWEGRGVPVDRLLLLFENDGRGGLREVDRVLVTRTPWLSYACMEAGDMNGDGWLDLVFAVPSRHDPALLAVLLNDRAGRLHVASVNTAPSGLNHLRLADWDGDGDLDAFTPSTEFQVPDSGVHVWVWRNDAGRLVKARDLVDPQSRDVMGMAVGDLNGDGRVDLVTTEGSVIAVNLELTGDSWPQYYGVDTLFVGVVIADFDGDGRNDVAAAEGSYGYVAIMLNRACPPAKQSAPPAAITRWR
jgi:hypothetical protein